MENLITNSILKNKILELRNLVEQLTLKDNVEKINILYMQIDGLVKQTRQYLKILNVGKDIDIIELNE